MPRWTGFGRPMPRMNTPISPMALRGRPVSRRSACTASTGTVSWARRRPPPLISKCCGNYKPTWPCATISTNFPLKAARRCGSAHHPCLFTTTKATSSAIAAAPPISRRRSKPGRNYKVSPTVIWMPSTACPMVSPCGMKTIGWSSAIAASRNLAPKTLAFYSRI